MPQLVRLHLPPAHQRSVAQPTVQSPSLDLPSVDLEAAVSASEAESTCPALRARTSALREFLAQATGSLVASGVRHALQGAGPAGAIAGAAWVGAGLAAAGWRAYSLSERALAGGPGRAHWACRLALAALPVAIASAVTMAVAPAQAPAAVLLFAGGLVERSVRDLSSHGLAVWLPRGEMVSPGGSGVVPALKVHIEWARALQAMPRTLACTALQTGLGFAIAPWLDDSPTAQAVASATGSGLLEAARAVINHRATEDQAHLHGLVMRPHVGQGVPHGLVRAADVCSLRETLALPADCIAALAGTPATLGGQAAMTLVLGTLKGIGEARSALVNLGRAPGGVTQHPGPSDPPPPALALEPPLQTAESDLSPVSPPA